MGGHLRSESASDLPPDNQREAWIRRNAAVLRRALLLPVTRMRVVELLNGEEQRRPGNDDEANETN
jgi:hypothetical protein